MKINHNMSAYVANSQLLKNEDKLTASLERLSSGYRINHASDDAAGMAISAKMKVQIAALDQASRNASDGISVVETAEGALNEVTSMIQRMRELSVQAGNDTYGDDDIQALQDEIEQLKQEITRVSTDTEFNKMSVLDGSLGRRVYANNKGVSLMEASEQVNAGTYSVTLTADATQAIAKGGAGETANPADGTLSINGVKVSIASTDTADQIYEKIRTAGEKAGVNVLAIEDTTAGTNFTQYPETAGYPDTATYKLGDALYFVSDDYGSKESITIECDSPELSNYLFGTGTTDTTLAATAGKDAKLTLDAGFSSQATVNANGKDIVISDRGGFEMDFMLSSSLKSKAGANVAIDLSVTDIGTMTLQVGANAGQQVEISIPNMSSESLRIDGIDVTVEGGSEKAITALDKALAKVSSVRATMGAGENRLNYTTSSIGTTNENMNSALSRIEDVDMASEMSTYTQMNVLTQAATSVLAQANDIPEQVLQLLQ